MGKRKSCLRYLAFPGLCKRNSCLRYLPFLQSIHLRILGAHMEFQAKKKKVLSFTVFIIDCEAVTHRITKLKLARSPFVAACWIGIGLLLLQVGLTSPT